SAPAPLRREGVLAGAPPIAGDATPLATRWAPLRGAAQHTADVAAVWIDPPPASDAPALALAQLSAALENGEPRLVVMRLPAGDGDELPLAAADAAVARAVGLLNRGVPRLATWVLAGGAYPGAAGRTLLAFGDGARRDAPGDAAALMAQVCALAELPAPCAAADKPHLATESAGLPRLSVVVPTYQREAQLGGLLDSLEGQTLFAAGAADCEVIVVVDGSHDGTLEALERRRAAWSARGVALRIATQPNQGAAA